MKNIATLAGLSLLFAGCQDPNRDPDHGADDKNNTGFVDVGVGSSYACGLGADGAMKCWGSAIYDREPPPEALAVVMSVGYDAVCWIDASDDTLGCAGLGTMTLDESEVNPPPEGTFIDVSVGRSGACALDFDGDLVCWNPQDPSDTEPFGALPEGPFDGLAVGSGHGVALAGGLVSAFGNYRSPEQPTATFLSVDAGYREVCGIRTDGGVECWADATLDEGDAEYANTQTPTDGVWLDVGAGFGHSCGIRDDGNAVCWGGDEFGQATAPDGTFVAVDASGEYSCGVLDDTSILCWGSEEYHGSPNDLDG